MLCLLSFLGHAEEWNLSPLIFFSTLQEALLNCNIERMPSSVHILLLQAVAGGSWQEHCHLFKGWENFLLITGRERFVLYKLQITTL